MYTFQSCVHTHNMCMRMETVLVPLNVRHTNVAVSHWRAGLAGRAGRQARLVEIVWWDAGLVGWQALAGWDGGAGGMTGWMGWLAEWLEGNISSELRMFSSGGRRKLDQLHRIFDFT